jgi:hypothetical protein
VHALQESQQTGHRVHALCDKGQSDSEVKAGIWAAGLQRYRDLLWMSDIDLFLDHSNEARQQLGLPVVEHTVGAVSAR